MIALPPALREKRWQPGQSGNPTGKGGLYHETVRLAREASPEAVRRLIEISKSDDERIAGYAANAILERAWGKPKEYDPKEDQGPDIPIDPSVLTLEQRQKFMAMLRMLLSATPTEGATNMAAGPLEPIE